MDIEIVFPKPLNGEIKGPGRLRYACEVLSEHGEKFKVKLLEDYRGNGRNRQGSRGDVLNIPKKAIKVTKP